MRALTFDAHGGPERLIARDDVPAPAMQPGAVRVRVRAASLNRLDLWTLGGLPGLSISPPWILGADAVGTVADVADGVTSVTVGDRVVINGGISCRQCEYCRAGEHSLCTTFRVLGEHLPGTFAEEIVVPATNVRRVGAALSDDAAAAFTLATLTAWRMCVTRAQVREGDEVLIWGIGGGVALASMLVCKSRGARVWVTSSSAAKLERARALGADEVLDHAALDVGREVRKRTGRRGVDVVIDCVGQATWAQSMVALARGGRLATCGGTSGHDLAIDVRRLFWHQWSILGSTMGNDAEFDAILAELAAGRLAPVVDSTFPLEAGRAAFERMQRGEQFGKIVLRVGG